MRTIAERITWSAKPICVWLGVVRQSGSSLGFEQVISAWRSKVIGRADSEMGNEVSLD